MQTKLQLEQLVGIPKSKRKKALSCLNSLLRFRDEKGQLSPIITGYNGYVQTPESDRAVTFSHIQEDEAYRQAMFSDLEKQGYKEQELKDKLRDKTSASLWELHFRIRGSGGQTYRELTIKYMDTDEELDLNIYAGDTLVAYPELKDKLYSENHGWELDLPFGSQKELLRLVRLFAKRAYRDKTKSWPGAYATPVLVLGERALDWEEKLPDFIRATKIELIEGENELSFIIQDNIARLKALPHYGELVDLGFKERVCLGNKAFIEEYVNRIRKV